MQEVWFTTYNFIGLDGNLIKRPLKNEFDKIREFESEDELKTYLEENSTQTGVIYQIHKGYIKK